MCLGQESNPKPFGIQYDTPTNWATWPVCKMIFKSKSSLPFAYFLFSSLLSLRILHNFPRCCFYWGVNVILQLCSIKINCYSPAGMVQWLSINLWGHSSVPGQGTSLGCGLHPHLRHAGDQWFLSLMFPSFLLPSSLKSLKIFFKKNQLLYFLFLDLHSSNLLLIL